MDENSQTFHAVEVAAAEAKAAVAEAKGKAMNPVIGREMLKRLESLLTLLTMAGFKF